MATPYKRLLVITFSFLAAMAPSSAYSSETLAGLEAISKNTVRTSANTFKEVDVAKACQADGIAVQYVKAIESRNAEQMSAFMAKNIHYQDPTMAYFGNDGINLEGRAATTDFWRQAFMDSNTQSLSYTVERCFVAGSIIVLNMSFNLRVVGSAWGIDHPIITLRLHHTMSLEIEKNEIIQQTDYVDYHAMTLQVAAMKARYGDLKH